MWRNGMASGVAGYLAQALGGTLAGLAAIAGLTLAYSGTKYVNEFPQDYNFLYSTNRPFASSLARTDTGGAFDARSLAGVAHLRHCRLSRTDSGRMAAQRASLRGLGHGFPRHPKHHGQAKWRGIHALL
jgi:hypothetical protein